MRNFYRFAPYYWSAGLPIIPVSERNGQPLIRDWAKFCNRMPSRVEQNDWLARYPNSDLGLALGPQSGLCMLRFEAEYEGLHDAIMQVAPPSPWSCAAGWNLVLAYKYGNECSFTIRDPSGQPIAELLAAGAYTLVPPSIDRMTGDQLFAFDHLWNLRAEPLALPQDFERKLAAELEERRVRFAREGSVSAEADS